MISAIAAIDENYGIGYKNELLCHIKEDLKHFRELTNNSIIVMGRKTWESLPTKPLPNRINVVITNSVESTKITEYKDKSAFTVFMNLNRAKNALNILGKTYNIFIIGGGLTYKELLPFCDYVYLTRIHKSFENIDTYFPKLNNDEWEVLEADGLKKQEDIEYHFETYKRIKK